MVEKLIMKWDDFGRASELLADSIRSSHYQPDIIICIARGGMAPGSALGYALNTKNVWSLNIEFYTGVDERLPLPIVLPPVPDVSLLSGMNILVVDDVSDTGKTLATVKSFCADKAKDIRFAVLYEKPWTEFQCDYVWAYTDQWIVFPWAAMEHNV